MAKAKLTGWESYTPLEADWTFYSDAWKDWCGSRPGDSQYEWFSSLTEAERRKEIQELCDSINEQTEREEVEHQEDLAQLQTYGDFTEKQLVAWGCL
jgi:hypothetical protein